jgi:hypothetical protein
LDSDDVPCIGVFRQRGPVFEMALPGEEVPSGALIGAIVFLDESWQSFRYGRNAYIGSFATVDEALLAFSASKAPPAPPSRVMQRARATERTVFCGHTRRCACGNSKITWGEYRTIRLRHGPSVR